jgi:hypothetical protein
MEKNSGSFNLQIIVEESYFTLFSITKDQHY